MLESLPYFTVPSARNGVQATSRSITRCAGTRQARHTTDAEYITHRLERRCASPKMRESVSAGREWIVASGDAPTRFSRRAGARGRSWGIDGGERFERC